MEEWVLLPFIISTAIVWIIFISIYRHEKKQEKEDAIEQKNWRDKAYKWWYYCVAPKDYTKYQWGWTCRGY